MLRDDQLEGEAILQDARPDQMANVHHVLIEENHAARLSSHRRIMYVTMVLLIRRDAEQRRDLRFDLVDGVVGINSQDNLLVAKFHKYETTGAAQIALRPATIELQGRDHQGNVLDVCKHGQAKRGELLRRWRAHQVCLLEWIDRLI